MQLELTYSKATKNTYVYSDDSPDAAIKTVYVNKSVIADGAQPPKTMTLIIGFQD